MTCAGAAAKRGPRLFAYGSDMALDFTSGVLDTRVTASGGANGTRRNSSGVIVAATCPRFDHDKDGNPLGLLVEEARTNLILRAEELDNASWNKARCSITANAIAAPDGATTADKIVEDNTTNTRFAQQAFSATSGTAYTVSVFMKKGERTKAAISFRTNNSVFNGQQAYFDLDAGTLIAVGTGITASIESFGNGWYRCIATQTAAATNSGTISIDMLDGSANVSYLGDGTSGFYPWGVQVEAGAFATSYIKTEGSTVTRSADVLSMTGTNFSSWYNQSEGTFVTNADTRDTANQPAICSASDGTNNNVVQAFASNTAGSPQYYVQVAGPLQADITGPAAVAAGTAFKWAVAYKVNDFHAAENGALAGAGDTSGTVPTVDRLHIGSRLGTARFLNGHIRRLRYHGTRLPNDDLERFTA